MVKPWTIHWHCPEMGTNYWSSCRVIYCKNGPRAILSCQLWVLKGQITRGSSNLDCVPLTVLLPMSDKERGWQTLSNRCATRGRGETFLKILPITFWANFNFWQPTPNVHRRTGAVKTLPWHHTSYVCVKKVQKGFAIEFITNAYFHITNRLTMLVYFQ